MTAVLKIDSNSTGLRYAKEASLKTLPANPVWVPGEPNSYKSFGASLKKVTRTPISASRQQSKGITVDLDAAGGMQQDFTYSNTIPFMEGLLYAAFRRKAETTATGVDATNGYEVASGVGFAAGDIIFASGFQLPANNGRKYVTGDGANSINAANLVAEAGSTGSVVRCGIHCAAGDISVDVSGGLPLLRSTALDFTTLGIIPGEWLYLGGDEAGNAFADAPNNGFVRVRAVTAHAVTLDKTQQAMVADSGAGVTLAIHFGRVIKNESDPSKIVRTTYTVERTLGAPDDMAPGQQAEYLAGCGFNEFVMTLNTADKITYEVSLVGADYSTASAATGLKAGARPNVTDSLAFNTTLNVKRAALAVVGTQASLFAYLSVGALTINNNIKPNKAIGVLGAFDTSAGIFAVSATATAYFTDVAALAAVRNNADCSFDIVLAAGNRGLVIDCPLVSLGESGLNVTANEAVTIPLTMDAARGASIDPNLDHTVCLTYFDYLPTRAM